MLIPSSPLIKALVLFWVWHSAALCIHAQSQDIFSATSTSLNVRQQRIVNTLQSLPTTKRLGYAMIGSSAFSGRTINANLFPDVEIELQKQNFTGGTALASWCGSTTGPAGSAAFVINAKRVSGHISTLEGTFEILPLDDNGVHAIIEHDNSKFGDCGSTSEQVPITQEDIGQKPAPQSPSHPAQRSVDQSECIIRLLVGYTAAAKENTMEIYNRTMVEHLNLAILLMNQSYVNSMVDQRVELAYLYQTVDNESDDSSSDVNDLRDTTDGRWDEIHALRDEYSADLVALVTGGLYSGVCGRAYGFNYSEESEMFQVTEYNCAVSNLTFAHEFGHLQGCRHDIDGNTSPFEFGHGFSQGGNYRTIMAVCCGADRINYWSNPYVYYPELGSMGTLNFNYNALALNTSYSVVADHRMNPDAITSDQMLATDHAITATTMGNILSSDTTMDEGCLVLQSESKITLSEGFKAYNGAMGRFRIISGCADEQPLGTADITTTVDRDSPPSQTFYVAKDSHPGLSRDKQ